MFYDLTRLLRGEIRGGNNAKINTFLIKIFPLPSSLPSFLLSFLPFLLSFHNQRNHCRLHKKSPLLSHVNPIHIFTTFLLRYILIGLDLPHCIYPSRSPFKISPMRGTWLTHLILLDNYYDSPISG